METTIKKQKFIILRYNKWKEEVIANNHISVERQRQEKQRLKEDIKVLWQRIKDMRKEIVIPLRRTDTSRVAYDKFVESCKNKADEMGIGWQITNKWGDRR